MNEIIEILKKMYENTDIRSLNIKNCAENNETTIRFRYHYIEFLPGTPFFECVLPATKRFCVDYCDGNSGGGMVTLVFDGVYDIEDE